MSRLSHAPRASVLAALVAASISAATPAGASTAVEKQAVLGAVARVYIELWRGTPVLLQLYLVYFGLGPYYAIGPARVATNFFILERHRPGIREMVRR